MILAIQYCDRDRMRAAKLARLLADLERTPRKDVQLALVRGSDSSPSTTIAQTLQYCSSKFEVKDIALPRGASGWPGGPNQMWIGLLQYFSNLRREGKVFHESIFLIDGGDGVPLHANWINLLQDEHRSALSSRKLIVGTLLRDGEGRLHVNGNLVMHPTLLDRCPVLDNEVPPYVGWDSQYGFLLASQSSLSSVIRNDWRSVGASPGMMEAYSRNSIWWHGYKDGNLVDVARSYLLEKRKGSPTFPTLSRQSFEEEFRGTFSLMLHRLSKRASPQTIIDIGASDGCWSRMARMSYPISRFLCIEANPAHERGLKRFCDSTNSEYSIALAGDRSHSTTTVRFNETNPYQGIERTEDGNPIQTTTIDDEIRRRNLPPPYLLKFDTHGYELDILQGAANTLRDTCAIVMEVYNWQQGQRSLRFWEMASHLETLGFLPSDLCEPMHRPFDSRLCQVNMLFERKTALGMDTGRYE